MNCPKCNNQVEVNDKFCKNCGIVLNSNLQKIAEEMSEPKQVFSPQIEYDNINTNFNNSNEPAFEFKKSKVEFTDDEYIKAYIGKNAEKILNCKWSWWGFLFGGIYLIYRKMWLLGITLSILSIALATINYLVYAIVFLIVSILLGIFFPKIYLNHVKKKVTKIKIENFQLTSEAICNLCQEKGGTALWAIFVYYGLIIIIIAGIALAFYLLFWNGIKDAITDINNFEFEIDDINNPYSNNNSVTDSSETVSGLYYQCQVTL